MGILLIFAVYVTYCSIFNISDAQENLKPTIIILGTITCIFAFVGIKKLLNKVKENKSNLIAIILCIIFFIGMAIVGNIVTVIPRVDLTQPQAEAITMLSNGGVFENIEYFASNINQVPLAIMVYFIYKLASILGFASYKFFAIIVNALLISITAFFTYLSAKRLKDHKLGLTTLIFFIVNPIFYISASYYYTDQFCMPFAMIAIYLFILATQSDKTKKQVICMLFGGIILALGFVIRVVDGILLIGMIIAIFINSKVSKKTFINIGSLILGFILGVLLYSLIAMPFEVPKDKSYEFPLTYWIMIGLNEETNGQWSNSDYVLAYEAEDYDERVSLSLEKIKSRLENLGVSGILKLLPAKLSVAWSNGYYNFEHRMSNVEEINVFYEYTIGNKRIFSEYLFQIFKATILLLFAISVLKELIKQDDEKSYKFIYISMFGAFLFYLIWEVQEPYSFAFLPWMMLTFGVGITQIEKNLNKDSITFRKIEIHKLDILRKIISIGALVITVGLLLINFEKYTIIESEYTDQIVIQDSVMSCIFFADIYMEQTFTVNERFNSIVLAFYKDDEHVKTETTYHFALTDSDGNIITEQEFTSSDVDNVDYKRFTFDYVEPDGKETYIIKLYSEDATPDNSLGIVVFYLKNFDSYPGGTLYVNGQNSMADLTFFVESKEYRTYTNKGFYITISIMIIALELFAFYPYIRKNKNDIEKNIIV